MKFAFPLRGSRKSLPDKKKTQTPKTNNPPTKKPPAQISPLVSLIHSKIPQFIPVLLNSCLTSRNKTAQHFEHRKSGITGIFQCVRCKRKTQSLHLSRKQCHSSSYFAHMAFLKPKIQRYWQRGKKNYPASSKVNILLCCILVIKLTTKNTFIWK